MTPDLTQPPHPPSCGHMDRADDRLQIPRGAPRGEAGETAWRMAERESSSWSVWDPGSLRLAGGARDSWHRSTRL